MFVLVLVLGVSVLDVLEYLIGENSKYLYLYLITSTWSIWVLDQLYLTPTMVNVHNYVVSLLLRRVLDVHCQIDTSQCLAQLTPARVGKARSVHVQLGASPHVIRWDIVCLSPQSHTSVWESFHIFIIARRRPFCTLSRFKLLQVDQGSSVPQAKCSFGMIPLSRHSVDRSPRAFHSSTHNVVRASCFEVLKLNFRKYPAIHTNYITSENTTL